MSMSKKDFVAVGEALRPLFGQDSPDDGFTKSEVLDALAGVFERINPQFKRGRWLEFVAEKCGPNGGAIKEAK